jgi:hypothetical protein
MLLIKLCEGNQVLQKDCFLKKIVFHLVSVSITISSTMLRRLSTTFRHKDKKQENGDTNGYSSKPDRRKSSVVTNGGPIEEDHSAKREGVSNIFQQFAQVLHAAQRPLPTQSGDGSYLDKEMPSGFLAELKTIGFDDVKTLKEVMEGKAKNELVDDKTYLMERVIKVRNIYWKF